MDHSASPSTTATAAVDWPPLSFARMDLEQPQQQDADGSSRAPSLADLDRLFEDSSDDASSSHGGPLPAEAVRAVQRSQRRRVQNRESARVCRTRRLKHYAQLRAEVGDLTEQNATLEAAKVRLGAQRVAVQQEMARLKTLVAQCLQVDPSLLFDAA